MSEYKPDYSHIEGRLTSASYLWWRANNDAKLEDYLTVFEDLKEISEYTHSNSKCRILWASCRQPYDYINAINSNSDIITMGPSMIKKLKNLNSITPEDYSKETVKNFYEDAKSSGFKI